MIAPCPHCHADVNPQQPFCGKCGAPVSAPPGEPQDPAARGPIFSLPVVIVLLSVIVALGTVAFVVCVTTQRREQREAAIAAAKAQREEARREELWRQHLAKSYQYLTTHYPAYCFVYYPGDSGMVPVNATLTKSIVRTLSFSRLPDSLDVTVGLMGHQAEPQDPTVYVGVWDDSGNLLARSAIVQFVSKELGPGETREVEDHMDLPDGARPCFVSVDEGEFTLR